MTMATVLKDKATMSRIGESKRRIGERTSAEVRIIVCMYVCCMLYVVCLLLVRFNIIICNDVGYRNVLDVIVVFVFVLFIEWIFRCFHFFFPRL